MTVQPLPRQDAENAPESPLPLNKQFGAEDSGAPEEFAALFSTALRAADAGRLRSAQTDGGLLGASDVGGCRQKAVYTIQRTPPSDVVKKGKAMIGTALHEVWLPQLRALDPALIVEPELTLTLPSGRQLLTHPDLVDPEGVVTDLKTVSDMAYRRRVGVEDKHRQQVHLYYLAALQNGLLTTDQGLVRVVYVSMTDADDIWVHQEPFDPAWLEAADTWFEDVAYAVEHDTDASRDGQPHFCASYCPFYSACKPPLTDASGVLTNPGLVDLAMVAREARDARKVWELVEKQSVEKLRGVSGTVLEGGFQVISTTVNGRNGPYERVEFREVG